MHHKANWRSSLKVVDNNGLVWFLSCFTTVTQKLFKRFNVATHGLNMARISKCKRTGMIRVTFSSNSAKMLIRLRTKGKRKTSFWMEKKSVWGLIQKEVATSLICLQNNL